MTSKMKIDGRTYGSMEAEALAAALCITKTVLLPKAARDDKRQAGARKPRGSRTPRLDAWLDKQRLDLTNEMLWVILPEDGLKLYRDGNKIIEQGRIGKDRKERPITRNDFNSRVTAARKRAKRS